MSVKNQLQEWCQHHKLPLPTYATRCNEETKTWISNVSIEWKGMESMSGEEKMTKKEAEISVAQQMLERIKMLESESKETPNATTIIFVDEDNCADVLDDLRTIDCPIVSIKSKVSGKVVDNVEQIIVRSTIKDTTDFYIALMIQREMMYGDYAKIILITRDHFGDALREALCEFYKNEANIEFHAVSSYEELKKII